MGSLKSILATHLGRNVTFGRKAPSPEKLSLVPKLTKYLDFSTLPTPPLVSDYRQAALGCLREILGNDQYGDCTCAGAAHSEGIWSGNAGTLIVPTTDQVLSMYSAITGFNPADPSTDQGADELSVLDWLVANGFPAGGSKLAGYVAVDGTNKAEVKLAAWMFGSVYLGISLPDTWISPFPNADGFTWGPGTPDPSNGHCVVSAYYDDAAGLGIDTWALFGNITWDGLAATTSPESGGQVYALLSEDWIEKATAKAPSGFDFATLQSDLQSMGSASRGGLTTARGVGPIYPTP